MTFLNNMRMIKNLRPPPDFVDPSGRTFDGTGIPPHLTEPVFTKEEFDKKRDSAFDRAVNLLRNYGGTTS